VGRNLRQAFLRGDPSGGGTILKSTTLPPPQPLGSSEGANKHHRLSSSWEPPRPPAQSTQRGWAEAENSTPGSPEL
jgi:hypothetical protein